MILFLVTIILTLLWSIDKGFDLADEGLHYALSNPKTTNNNGLFNYDLFFKLFYAISNFEFGIIGLRLLKFISLVLLFILGLPLFRKNNFSVLDKLFLAIAIFCSYTYLTQSLSYNTISFIIVLSYIYTYSILNNSSVSRQNVLLLLMAILSSLCFFSKPPLSLVLLGMTFMLTTISFSKLLWRRILFQFFLIVMGYVGVQLIFQIVFPDYTFFKVLKDAMELSTYYGSYNKSILIKRLVVSFKWVFVLSLTGWIVAYVLKTKQLELKKIIIAFLSIAVLLSYFFISHSSSNEFDVFQYGLMILSALAIGFFLCFTKSINFNWQKSILLLLLFVAPFICTLGSNVYFFRSGQQYLFFWFTLLVYLNNTSVSIPKQYVLLLYFIFSGYITVKVFNNVIVNPDNQPKLSDTFVNYNYGYGKNIKIDKDQANYLTHLKIKLNKYSPNRKEIIGLYAMPGDIILTGFVNYYCPLIWDDFQWKFIKDRINHNDKYINKAFPLLITKDLKYRDKIKMENYRVVDSVKDYKSGYIYICKPIKI